MSEPRAHAFYAPSSAYVWMECAPSVLIDLGDFDDSDEYNNRGTFLHDCGEQGNKTGTWSYSEATKRTGIEYEPTLDDATSVQVYVDHIATLPGRKWFEVKSQFIRGLCGGTSDAVVFDPETGTLYIIDYKAGFIKRAARGNYQLVIYALGVVRKLQGLYNIKRVEMTIIQPMHGEEPDTWKLKLSELERWGKRVKARVDFLESLRKAGKLGDYSPSDDRCQFCKVGKAMKCEELERAGLAAATEDFEHYERASAGPEPAPIVPLTDAEKWEVAKRAETWAKNFRESVTSQVLAGTHPGGFKIVEGQGSWQVQDRRGFVEHLASEGFGETDIFVGEPTLVSLNQAKQLYSGKGSGKKRERLAEFFRKEPGGPKVVLESDPREPMTTAEGDFANYKRGDKT